MVPLADDARALGMGKKPRDNAIASNRFPVEIVSKGPFRGCARQTRSGISARTGPVATTAN
jgi:hypothetical protein